MLGRKPTREERRAGMQVRRTLAREAGQPFVAINPDNWQFVPGHNGEPATPDFADWRHRHSYPETMTNPQMRDYYPPSWLFPNLGRPPTREELRAGYRGVAATSLIETDSYDPETGMTYRHPIHPNANIRNPHTTYHSPDYPPESLDEYTPPTLNIDPRLPERYNRTLPPNKQMTQEQMDKIRRDYYQMNPNLIPVRGQPAYNAWERQLKRGK
jgi:hypothetical protein